ncbi:MOSC domain-containing protein [Paenibacillus hamazuiensis]|uniref:MOSC domain-containing protein n=1 Tax=Paenibacillus hamazuiensis TaxID=2936508 RepID=UPI00200E95A5|nr:MOSC domain-containing protein [Paenibacillus hamazuiensis]
MKNVVTALYKVAAAGEPMVAVDEVKTIPGKGLEGDRYSYGAGTWSQRSPDRDLTIIDTAALERLQSEFGITLAPGEHRRNIETEGINPLDLIGKEFTIGSVSLYGVRVCHPCKYLEDLTGKSGLLKGMMNSGVFVRILSEGTIMIGDEVKIVSE